MNSKLLKLARMVLKLGEISTDKGLLIYEGELAEGVEVFIEDENGELQPAPNGEYEAEDKIYVIEDGKVAEIRDKEPEAKPAEEPENQEPENQEPENQENLEGEENPENQEPEGDDKDAKIAELEAKIEELNNIIAEKDEEIGNLKSKLEGKEAENEELNKQLHMSTDKPADQKLKEGKTEGVKPWMKSRF